MPLPITIKDCNRVSKITEYGALYTANAGHDKTFNAKMTAANTAYNLLEPKTSKKFVITGLFIKAQFSVSNSVAATIIVYEAGSRTSLTVVETIINLGLIRDDIASIFPINILVNTGVWVNAKTDDPTVDVVLFGFPIDD